MFVIFDLDGTLADITHRLHFIKRDKPDWNAFHAACHDDAPKWPVINLLRAIGPDPRNRIEIWSGRMDTVRSLTESWLIRHSIWSYIDGIMMRPEGDFTPDHELKERWLKEMNHTPPDIVFDDRQKVVDMWRANGITCAQVEQWEE